MEALGINPVLLIAQIISFLVLWFVLNKFLFKHIQKALDDRRAGVKKIFSDKEELETRLANLEKEQETKRKELYAYGKKLEGEAKQTANEIKKEIVAKAASEGERELVKARERIDQEVETAKKTLATEATVVAREIAEKIIGEQAKDKSWQKKELDKSLTAMRTKK
jgi:F-type H+-transporting ATPase subunit b